MIANLSIYFALRRIAKRHRFTPYGNQCEIVASLASTLSRCQPNARLRVTRMLRAETAALAAMDEPH